VAVAVDVEGRGTGDRVQIGDWRRQLGERERATDRAVVVVERRRRAATGEEQLAAAVVVAVERGHTAADEVLEVTFVAVIDAGILGHEVRRVCCVGSGPAASAPGGRADREDRHRGTASEPPHERIEPHGDRLLTPAQDSWSVALESLGPRGTNSGEPTFGGLGAHGG
jgi:hypothetical protein